RGVQLVAESGFDLAELVFDLLGKNEEFFAVRGSTPGDIVLFFFKQKTAYEIGLGIPAEPLFRSMVRSYYPSECHADYFDFERIEALKPAIEACGISTLSQSPMLGFHKQMDNRIKLLEEILSFRMQGVEFDN